MNDFRGRSPPLSGRRDRPGGSTTEQEEAAAGGVRRRGSRPPRVCVTWYEAQAYAHWRGGRLLTEAEWEYAARGPESRIYPSGDTFDATKANVVDSSGLVPVGSYPEGVS